MQSILKADWAILQLMPRLRMGQLWLKKKIKIKKTVTLKVTESKMFSILSPLPRKKHLLGTWHANDVHAQSFLSSWKLG